MKGTVKIIGLFGRETVRYFVVLEKTRWKKSLSLSLSLSLK